MWGLVTAPIFGDFTRLQAGHGSVTPQSIVASNSLIVLIILCCSRMISIGALLLKLISLLLNVCTEEPLHAVDVHVPTVRLDCCWNQCCMFLNNELILQRSLISMIILLAMALSPYF